MRIGPKGNSQCRIFLNRTRFRLPHSRREDRQNLCRVDIFVCGCCRYLDPWNARLRFSSPIMEKFFRYERSGSDAEKSGNRNSLVVHLRHKSLHRCIHYRRYQVRHARPHYVPERFAVWRPCNYSPTKIQDDFREPTISGEWVAKRS